MSAAKNLIYWADRAKAIEAESNMSNVNRMMQMSQLYDESLKSIEKEIKKILQTFAHNNQLTESTAKNLLSSSEFDKWFETLKAKVLTIEDKAIRRQMQKLLDAPAYKYRISRLEALERSIDVELSKYADEQIKIIRKQATKNYTDAYYKTIHTVQAETGIGFNFNAVPMKALRAALDYKWSGNHYSKRVWKNTQILAKQAKEIIKDGITTGNSFNKLSSELADNMECGKYQAARVVRTEMNYFHNQGTLEGLKETGCKKYVFIATLDERTCGHNGTNCRDLDLKTFDLSKAKVGKNHPPIHPNCRCTIAGAYSEDDIKMLRRRARDPKTGKVKEIPHGMSYNEWYEQYVKEDLKDKEKK